MTTRNDPSVQISRCPRCASPLSTEQCGGLCSKCLAKALMEDAELLGNTESAADSPIRFDNLALIGSGGMGAIYEAYDRRLARTVALKFLHSDLMTNPAARLRFELETILSSYLEHPGVIPIYDAGFDVAGRPFYVMRRVQGETLHDILSALARRDPAYISQFPLSRLISILEKICRAVSYAHGRKIIHRDLKPANIMLSKFEEAFVMDWGLAKPLEELPGLESLAEQEAFFAGVASCERERILRMAALRSDTSPNQILGTVGFMAPEQEEGNAHEADVRTDVYALGAMLYNILTLKAPDPGDRQTAGSHGIPHPLESAGSKWFRTNDSLPHWPKGRIPRPLAEAAMKALSMAPGARFQTADELRRILSEFGRT